MVLATSAEFDELAVRWTHWLDAGCICEAPFWAGRGLAIRGPCAETGGWFESV